MSRNSPCRKFLTNTQVMNIKRQKLFMIAATTIVILSWTMIYQFLKILPPDGDLREVEIELRLRGPLAGDDEDLISHVRKHYLSPPSGKPYNLSKPNELGYMMRYKGDSWRYIDTYLKTLFSDGPPGFFIEAGALDGEFLSNTLWLEMNRGWRGLLIEPDNDSFRYLSYKHRHAWTIRACLSTNPYPKETIHVSQRYWNNLGTVGTKWNYRGSAHELSMEIMKNNSVFASMVDEFYSVVQCFPLITLLKALNVSTVDFLSLDIQGGEKSVLRHLPFDSIRIRTMAIEIYEETIDWEFIQFMESKGYRLVNQHAIPPSQDHIYVQKDETLLFNKLRKVHVIVKT